MTHQVSAEPAVGGASVAELIHRRLNDLTPSERKAARLLLANPVAGLEPLSTLARRAEVSHPSVLRFIAKLGYDGLAEFRAALRAEFEARIKSPLAKHYADKTVAPEEGDFLARYAESVCDNVRESLAALPRGEFEQVVELLGNSRNPLYLLGGRFTDSVATYAYMHLRVLRARVQHINGPPVSWSEYVLDMNSRSVLLVFDIRRYQDDVVRFAQEAAERGARIVLLTDNWLSPIAGNAEHVLTARIEVPSSWDSVAAIGTLMEALIGGVTNSRWPKLKGRIRELERMRGHFDGSTTV